MGTAAPTAAQSARERNHCVGRVERITPGKAEAKIVSERCYTTFAQAIGKATAGRVRLKEGQTLNSSHAVPTGSVGTSYVIGIDYDACCYGSGGFGSYTYRGSANRISEDEAAQRTGCRGESARTSPEDRGDVDPRGEEPRQHDEAITLSGPRRSRWQPSGKASQLS